MARSQASTVTTTAKTQTVNDNSTKLATDAFVQNVAETSQISTLTVIGHSWTALANADGSGVPMFNQQNMIPRLMGLLGVHSDNLNHLGTGASYLTKTQAVFGGRNTGWGGVFQFVVPYSNQNVADQNILNITVPVPQPSAYAIVHGVNDIGIMSTNTTAFNFGLIQTAYQNALRAILSRIRAGALYCSYYSNGSAATVAWDSTITTSGFTSTPQTASNTGVAIYRSSTNGNTLTYTIPANFTGGTIAMCFLGNTNAWSLCNTVMNNTDVSTVVALTFTTGTPYTAFANGDVIAWYNNGVDSGERGLITAGGGTASITVTRGFNSTAKATHAVNDEIVKASSVGVTFTTSGANANIPGTLALGAKGTPTSIGSTWNERVPVVKRFVCTAADAGKTIVATVNAVASDTATVDFDSVWIETFDPQPVVVTNLPRYAYIQNGYVTEAQMGTFNTGNSSVVAEFDGAIQIADLDTTIHDRGGTLTSNILIGATSFNVTASNAAVLATLPQNTTFCIEAERILVGSIVNNGGGSFTFSSVTRGYDGTAAAAHTSGKLVSDGIWFHTDCLHFNGYGMNVAANLMYQAFKAYQGQSNYSLSTGAGNFSDDRRAPYLGVANNSYNTFTPITNLANAAGVLNTQYFYPIYIPQTCIITQVGCVITTVGVTSTVCRFGLYDLDSARRAPATLWHDFGTVNTVSSGTGYVPVNTYKLVRPGWYYISSCEQGTGTASIKRGLNSSAAIQGYAGVPIGTLTAPAVAAVPVWGFTQASVTGAFAASVGTLVEVSSATAIMPTIWVKVLARTWA